MGLQAYTTMMSINFLKPVFCLFDFGFLSFDTALRIKLGVLQMTEECPTTEINPQSYFATDHRDHYKRITVSKSGERLKIV